MASPTLTETEIEIVKLTAQHLALKNMCAEITGVLVKYEKQDSAMFANYADVKAILTAMVNMQSVKTTQMKTLTTAVSAV